MRDDESEGQADAEGLSGERTTYPFSAGYKKGSEVILIAAGTGGTSWLAQIAALEKALDDWIEMSYGELELRVLAFQEQMREQGIEIDRAALNRISDEIRLQELMVLEAPPRIDPVDIKFEKAGKNRGPVKHSGKGKTKRW